MIIKAGALVYQDGKLLICHPTGSPSNQWNLPKGHIESGESIFDGMVRECLEETGIDLKKYAEKIKQYPKPFPYYNGAVLHLYTVDLKSDYNPNYNCKSTFIDEHTGERKPEMDAFLTINPVNIPLYFTGKLLKIILEVNKHYHETK